MNRSIPPILTAGLLMLGLASARATEPQTLSLKEAEKIALQRHPGISAADLNALASKQVVREVRSAFFPAVTGNITAVGTADENTRIAAGALNNPLILQRAAAGINVSQLITDFGRTANLTASSRLHSQAEEESALATRAQIVLQVDSVFFDALQAQSVVQVAKQTVDTRQLLFQQVSQLASNNLKSGLDVSFARVSLEEGRLLLVNAENDLSAAFARLANLLADRGKTNYTLAEEPAPAGAEAVDASRLVETALQDRPDLGQLRLERDAADKFARAQRELHYPTLSAVGSAGVIPVHDPLLKDNYAAAGVNLSVPIFDGMLFTAQAKAAQLRADAAAEKLREAENNVVRDVRIAALNLGYAGERLGLTASLVESASESFSLAQARYSVGSSSIVELSQAQLSMTEAEIAQARAKYEYQLRNAILNYELGKLP